MKHFALIVLSLFTLCIPAHTASVKETWPDGTAMDAWFQNTKKVDVSTLGRRYVVTD